MTEGQVERIIEMIRQLCPDFEASVKGKLKLPPSSELKNLIVMSDGVFPECLPGKRFSK